MLYPSNISIPANGSWSEQKAKLRQMFTELTDEDLNYEDNKKKEMLDKAGTKIGKTLEELEAIISSL